MSELKITLTGNELAIRSIVALLDTPFLVDIIADTFNTKRDEAVKAADSLKYERIY